jgi:putative redox protein
MTMRMSADRKGFPLERVGVTLRHDKIHAEGCAEGETKGGRIDHIQTEIEIVGDTDDETRLKIYAIADKCHVHRSLTSEVKIESALRE